jgi:hypothetical protein
MLENHFVGSHGGFVLVVGFRSGSIGRDHAACLKVRQVERAPVFRRAEWIGAQAYRYLWIAI